MTGRIAILGAGAWGTALAAAQAAAGRNVILWGRDVDTVAAINREHRNPRYLQDVPLPDGVSATADPVEALAGASLVLSVVPAQATRQTLTALSRLFPGDAPLVLCAKGIETGTGRLMSDIAAESMPRRPVAALSGPSFAHDVAGGLPTAVTLACADADLARTLAARLSTRTLRLYSTSDIAGVEAGGALKNVLAIAVGAARGLGLGASAEAALATRGFVELRRMADAFGARPETLMGLSGLGDLMLTCSSPQSRNFAFGMSLARGETVEARPLAEGVATAHIAHHIATERGIKAPIIGAVAALIAGSIAAQDAVTRLMDRAVIDEDA